jgi:hypothetical protein
MNLETISEIYQLISDASYTIIGRNNSLKLRKAGFESISNKNGFKKLAFDTRRIDQEVQYNPRRGLQNYHRSEQFITEATSQKLKNFGKLRRVLESLKEEFGKEAEWQDSYARVLLSTLDKGLRIKEQDGDFSDAQPSMGSLDYIEELLHVRYRLTFDDLSNKSEKELKKVILSKDEELIRKDVNHALQITKQDVGEKTYNDLVEKLFGGIKATKENPEVERTVTITIKDKIV